MCSTLLHIVVRCWAFSAVLCCAMLCCGRRGVYWDRHLHRWRSQMGHKDRKIFMGYFDSLEDAARAYDRQAVAIHGRLGKSTLQAAGASSLWLRIETCCAFAHWASFLFTDLSRPLSCEQAGLHVLCWPTVRSSRQPLHKFTLVKGVLVASSRCARGPE